MFVLYGSVVLLMEWKGRGRGKEFRG